MYLCVCGAIVCFFNHQGMLSKICFPYDLAIKKEWNNAIGSNMDEPRYYDTKWSKSERERQIPYNVTYMWNLNYNTNELTWKMLTDTENRLVVAG